MCVTNSESKHWCRPTVDLRDVDGASGNLHWASTPGPREKVELVSLLKNEIHAGAKKVAMTLLGWRRQGDKKRLIIVTN